MAKLWKNGHFGKMAKLLGLHLILIAASSFADESPPDDHPRDPHQQHQTVSQFGQSPSLKAALTKLVPGLPLNRFVASPAVHPINIGPLVSITSTSDRSKGPFFSIDAGTIPPTFGILLDGQLRISVLQVDYKATAKIDNEGFRVTVYGSMFGLPSEFTVYAMFKNKTNPSSFGSAGISGSFGGNMANTITGAIESTLNTVKNLINGKLNMATRVVRIAEHHTKQLLKNKIFLERQKKIKDAAYSTAIEALRVAQRAVDTVCSVSNCRSVCLPRPCIKHKCHCVYRPCGWFESCCSSVCVPYPSTCGDMCTDDPVCVAKNVACQPLRFSAEHGLAAARNTLKTAKDALDEVVKAYQSAVDAFNKYNPVFLLAKEVLHQIQALLNRILHFLNPMPLVINRISFKMEISTAVRTAFQVSLEVTVFGQKQTLRVTLNLDNPAASGERLARRVFPTAFKLLNQIPRIPTL